jgi:peptidylprolyl isomerase
MKTVENGNFVKLHYTGRLGNGEIFDSSQGCQPLEVQVGRGHVIKGFEDALFGMVLNEKKTFTLTPDEAYGERDEEAFQSFMRDKLPPGFQAEAGQVIGIQSSDGCQAPAVITHVDDEKIVVDLNHPLAGQSLTFDIEVVEINDQPTVSACGPCSGCD